MITNKILGDPKLRTAVDVSGLHPQNPHLVERLIVASWADPGRREKHYNKLAQVLESKRPYLVGFEQAVIRCVNPDYKPHSRDRPYHIEIRGGTRNLWMTSPDSPIVVLQTGIKTVRSLSDKVWRELYAPPEIERALSGKIDRYQVVEGQRIYQVRDGLRARIVTPDADVNRIDEVVSALQSLPKNSTALDFQSTPFRITKNYTHHPKDTNYGKYGVVHGIVEVGRFGPLIPVEMQIMTQEQAYREALDQYHGRKADLISPEVILSKFFRAR